MTSAIAGVFLFRSQSMKVAIVGGGAAGFFGAIHVKLNYPAATVHILEKSAKVLSKEA